MGPSKSAQASVEACHRHVLGLCSKTWDQASPHRRALKLVTGTSLACAPRYGEPSKSALSSDETCHRRVSLACAPRHGEPSKPALSSDETCHRPILGL
eukprot:1161902-Pelagomonas_calceolata.AAC.16